MRWLFGDGRPSDVRYADKVLAALRKSTAIVPQIWSLEAANVVSRAESKRVLNAKESDEFINGLRRLRIRTDQETSNRGLSDVFSIARTHNLSAYDAAYLELALRLGVPLATLDDGLIKAAKRASVERL